MNAPFILTWNTSGPFLAASVLCTKTWLASGQCGSFAPSAYLFASTFVLTFFFFFLILDSMYLGHENHPQNKNK